MNKAEHYAEWLEATKREIETAHSIMEAVQEGITEEQRAASMDVVELLQEEEDLMRFEQILEAMRAEAEAQEVKGCFGKYLFMDGSVLELEEEPGWTPVPIATFPSLAERAKFYQRMGAAFNGAE